MAADYAHYESGEEWQVIEKERGHECHLLRGSRFRMSTQRRSKLLTTPITNEHTDPEHTEASRLIRLYRVEGR